MSRLIFDTLRRLESRQLAWCVLRDGDELARGEQPAEVDLLVAEEQFAEAAEVLAECGFVRVPAWGHRPHHFFLKYDQRDHSWLKLDVVTRIAFGRRSHALSTDLATDCLGRRRKVGDVFVPAAEDELLLLVLHCLLDKGRFAEARRQRVAELCGGKLDDAYMALKVAQHFPNSLGWVQMARQIREGNWSALLAARSAVAANLRRRAPLSTLGRAMADFGLRRLHRAVRLLAPATPAVAIVAPDGAGKSTLIESLSQTPVLHVRSVHMGLYRQGQRPARWRRLPAVGLAANLLTQWSRWLHARALRARGCLVLFDRYTYDAVLPTSSRLSPLRRWRRRLLAHTCPAPDMVVMLDAPGEVLFARKGEHSAEHLERQRQGYLAMRGRLPQMAVVDATQDAQSVSREVSLLIWRALAARLAGRPSA
jgi:thymidylate kinase